MQEAYPNANIRYLGENVINNLCDTEYQTEELISKKEKSDIILFIGQKKYIEGAKLLIHALMGMRDKGKTINCISLVCERMIFVNYQIL